MATSALLRALRRPSNEAALRLVISTNRQAATGYRHLNNRNMSVFNEFSKQLKGEAKSNPEFQKTVKEFSEKLGVVKEDLKVRTKKTPKTIYKSVDGVWSEAEETSKKVTANVKEKMSAAKEEVAEDVRERWETSDNPVVQKIQDWNESVFEETTTAITFKEIRQRDPSFSLPDFVADVQEMIKPVLTAYSKILHISDADVLETKMMGSTPIIIAAFRMQQIYCIRDKEGQVTEGGQDVIQTVFCHWAMQLMDSDEVPEEESYYPVWRLREMQQAGVKALI
ncbi:hypothetical protein PR202_ga04109 [Eleusine coracana subsp. coracana]|uniref:Tim44-like domain-containing protein n=1 Tax=Eleusine coracana subsp. coracana TaxID=191504 RepID=A0AAV5BQW5_ELECO|nr:hypothetical protein PR202_ga04109 [Eleusine coracana subsp. coracana]